MTTANWITLAVGVLASVIAICSVVVALRANARSTEANRIATQSLAAQERVLPPAWSAAADTEPNKIGLTNQSGRHIVIEKLDVEPEAARRFVRLSHHLPTRVEYGDVYEFVVLGAGAEAVVLTWHFEGHSTIHSTERLL